MDRRHGTPHAAPLDAAPLGDAPPGAAPLSAAAEALYRQILDQGGAYELPSARLQDHPTLEELFNCGLVGLTDPNSPKAATRSYTAVDPHLARDRWHAHLHRQALARIDELDAIGEALDRMAGDYDASAPTTDQDGGGFEVIRGGPAINTRIGQLAAAATLEVLTLQPGARPSAMIRHVSDRDLDAARRLSWRTLYEAEHTHDPVLHRYVDVLTAAGAQFRTARRLIGRLFVIDRRTAIVPVHTGTEELAACFITEPVVVAHLRGLFLTYWRQAEPFAPQPAQDVAPLTPAQEQILALLHEGQVQSQIARSTGLKARTCSAHIAELKQRHGASTLFQLGAALAREGS